MSAQPIPSKKPDIPDLIAGALGVSRGDAYTLMLEALADGAGKPMPKLEQSKPAAWWKRHSDGSVELNEAGTFLHDDAIATGRRALVFADELTPQFARECSGIPRDGCEYLAHCGSVCNKCGEVHRIEPILKKAQQSAEFDSAQEYINSLDPSDQEAMFEQIDLWARKSYLRHRSGISGQQLSPGDAFETHVIFAAIKWAQEHPAKITTDQARRMGEKGGPVSEEERQLFEAWMRGHCFDISGWWDGTTYVHPSEGKNTTHLEAMRLRLVWAAWRDRAALSANGKGGAA